MVKYVTSVTVTVVLPPSAAAVCPRQLIFIVIYLHNATLLATADRKIKETGGRELIRHS